MSDSWLQRSKNKTGEFANPADSAEALLREALEQIHDMAQYGSSTALRHVTEIARAALQASAPSAAAEDRRHAIEAERQRQVDADEPEPR